MRNCFSKLPSITAGMLLFAGFAFSAAADGTWTGSLSTPEGAFAQVFKLKTEGAKVSGTLKNAEGPDVAISGGRVKGDRISFTVTLDSRGKHRTLNYRGV